MVSDLGGFELEEGMRNGVNGAKRWGTLLLSVLLTEVCNTYSISAFASQIQKILVVLTFFGFLHRTSISMDKVMMSRI